ncbi:MAG: hypothetical protein H6553_08215 [Chitinophagales bacterium]|nr:hypothetical protein [Chitinophagales bacterium]
MKNYSIFLLVVILFFACKRKTNSDALNPIDAEEYVEQELEEGMKAGHYRAFGNEPFWMLDVNDSINLFTKLDEKIDSIYLERDTAIIANDKIEIFFKSTDNQKVTLILSKSKTPCSDGMSDNTFEYASTFTYKEKTYKGCAENILDVVP